MTYARRTDSSHAEVRDTLRKLGYTVIDTSRFGGGFPDLVCWGPDARICFVEVKAARGRLRAAQEKFAASCPRYVVLRSAEEAIRWWREEAA